MNLGETGKRAEDLTAAFLRKQGCEILKRNYSCRFGEIDIIAQKENLILFVEVKARLENSLFSPIEAVDERKAQRIILTAEDYIVKSGTDLQPRFDVAQITVTRESPPKYKLEYTKNAF